MSGSCLSVTQPFFFFFFSFREETKSCFFFQCTAGFRLLRMHKKTKKTKDRDFMKKKKRRWLK